MKTKIYLDDLRTPKDDKWIVVRDFYEFKDKVSDIGLENIDTISLDHDLGDTAVDEYYNNVQPNYKLNYKNIEEKTGLDCVKWLIQHYYNNNPDRVEKSRSEKKVGKFNFPNVYVHSANPIGAHNMIGYINNFYKNEGQKQSCERVKIPHTVD
jgi:hypothetical protein